METVPERLVAWVLRSAAGLMLFAGVSIFIAAIPLFAFLTESPAPRAIATVLLQLGGSFLAGGIAAKVFLGRGQLLANERVSAGEHRPPLSSLLFACGLTFIAAPVWLVIEVRPFLAEWRQIIDLLSTPGLWDNANANMSGVILIPIFGALTPPFIELVTIAAFVSGPALLVPLLWSRSPRFPRLYLVYAVMLTTLVIASWRGASAAALAGSAIRDEAARIQQSADEFATMNDVLQRYDTAVSTTLPPLVWALFAYLAWAPLILTSSVAQQTFARRPEPPPGAATADGRSSIEAITQPPRFPGAF